MLVDRILIGTRWFVSSNTQDYRSTQVSEMCTSLESLHNIKNLFASNIDSTQIELSIASDFLRVIRKLDKESKCISMCNKMHPMFREFLSMKLKRSCYPKHVTLDAQQSNVKSFN